MPEVEGEEGAAAVVTDRVADCFWTGLPLSETVTVKVEVPDAEGAPEITPVVAARVRPAGNAPEMDHV